MSRYDALTILSGLLAVALLALAALAWAAG